MRYSIGLPCTLNAECGNDWVCNADRWCSPRTCTVDTECNPSFSGLENRCFELANGTASRCFPGCNTDADCTRYAGTVCDADLTCSTP